MRRQCLLIKQQKMRSCTRLPWWKRWTWLPYVYLFYSSHTLKRKLIDIIHICTQKNYAILISPNYSVSLNTASSFVYFDWTQKKCKFTARTKINLLTPLTLKKIYCGTKFLNKSRILFGWRIFMYLRFELHQRNNAMWWALWLPRFFRWTKLLRLAILGLLA